MNPKDIFLIILVIALAGLSYYLYSQLIYCKGKAEECAAGVTQLQDGLAQCQEGIGQYQDGLEECTAQATECAEALSNLQQMCAPYLPTQ